MKLLFALIPLVAGILLTGCETTVVDRRPAHRHHSYRSHDRSYDRVYVQSPPRGRYYEDDDRAYVTPRKKYRRDDDRSVDVDINLHR